MLLLANVAELNLTSAMVRFLPTAGDRSKAFILSCYTTVACLGVSNSARRPYPCFGIYEWCVNCLHLGRPGGSGSFLPSQCGVCSLFQDAVAIALRGSTWVPVENASYGVVKLVVLIAVATTAPRLGISRLGRFRWC